MSLVTSRRLLLNHQKESYKIYKIEMFIGHRRIGGEPAPLYKILAMEHKCQLRLGRLFRGGWMHSCEGFYLNENDRLMFEPCSILNSTAAEISEDKKAQLLELAGEVAYELDQESVLVNWFRLADSEMHLVPPSRVPLVRNKRSSVRVMSRKEKYAS